MTQEPPSSKMSFMSGRLRSLALLIPILLLAFTLLMWARSYLPDQTFFRSHQGRLLIFFATGQYVHWFDPSSNDHSSSENAVEYCRRVAQVQPLPSHQLAGFEWTNLDFKSSFPGFVAIPYWAISSLLAALLLWAFLLRRSQRERLLPGHCRACGYDLRGSNGKCPECGEDVPPAGRTTSSAASR